MPSNLLKYLPAVVLLASIVATASVSQYQITANAEEIKDNSESIDETEEDLTDLQLLLLRQQGAQKTEIQELRGDIKLILRLLEQDN